ncbi:MAG: MFS transporter [Kiritimatiellae bacterium]|nr:MFS transporter [Verrucomicrobiota bacterium]MBU4367051.1 MFS transporter [Verrucomicrobiota bacterium]MCG2659444.1 MFS transporter [Kiritimatiellia bacterium]
MTDAGQLEAIRKARGKFICMASTFSLGVFNDNFYKQAALLMIVSAGRSDMQGYALAIYTLPFIVLAAPAGWMADRFAKRKVVIGAKWMELIAMLFGAAGICTGNWILIFSMLAIMGAQSAFFSPALNSSIPELYPSFYVIRANGILRMAVTFAILGGIALGGFALDRKGTGWHNIPLGQLTVAVGVMGVALAGLIMSIGVPRRPAADPSAKFPWSGPAATIRKLWATRLDPLLALTIGASVFIWFLGSLQVLLINPLGIQQFGLSKSMTSFLIVAQLVGIGIGGLLSSYIAVGPKWHRVVTCSGILFSILMMAMVIIPRFPASLHLSVLFVMIAAIGITGGIFLVPVESFIQVRPAPKEKGSILAAANFVVFTGIMLSGLISNIFNKYLTPITSFGVTGVLALLVSVWLHIMYIRKEKA